MENRVGDAKWLSIEEAKDNLPVTLSHQTEYQAEQRRSQENVPPEQPLQRAHYCPGPKMCFSFGCQARCQYQIPQKHDGKDDGCREEDQQFGFQNSGIDTAITQAVEPEPLGVEPLQYIYQDE